MSSRKLDQQGDNITTRPHLWAAARCLTNLRGLVAAAAAATRPVMIAWMSVPAQAEILAGICWYKYSTEAYGCWLDSRGIFIVWKCEMYFCYIYFGGKSPTLSIFLC